MRDDFSSSFSKFRAFSNAIPSSTPNSCSSIPLPFFLEISIFAVSTSFSSFITLSNSYISLSFGLYLDFDSFKTTPPPIVSGGEYLRIMNLSLTATGTSFSRKTWTNPFPPGSISAEPKSEILPITSPVPR